ncbi:BZ3500_MvSof-1268-A1-R1_Chr1-3g02267 [Microbotryum saponariae]|uniref:BZ3500_MvSof-1268-A1-R1_Chr1-3g02267 protein n=1 Tax=Microbotryum saponariae TaxID=289078 RepID=A0A2X0KU19_9BASI|nr:BZ3500_MvSof-1268-A1-R1_Chr1-3g02267 [Microbotryum saponariae]SCZ95828.1 BZ3501_MvSof-1269-A2-R1_Chr1-3g01870 [Microbotryum saponariae]
MDTPFIITFNVRPSAYPLLDPLALGRSGERKVACLFEPFNQDGTESSGRGQDPPMSCHRR